MVNNSIARFISETFRSFIHIYIYILLLCEKPSGLDCAAYYPRRLVESRQGKAMVRGFEDLGSPSQAGSIVNRIQSTPCYDILNCNCFSCLKLSININLLSSVTQKSYKKRLILGKIYHATLEILFIF